MVMFLHSGFLDVSEVWFGGTLEPADCMVLDDERRFVLRLWEDSSGPPRAENPMLKRVLVAIFEPEALSNDVL